MAIASAVYFKRKLLILDEPTSALAVRATQSLFEYLRSVRETGVSSVLVTHNLHDAYRICDRFVVMSRGRAFAKRRATGARPEGCCPAAFERAMPFSATVNARLIQKNG